MCPEEHEFKAKLERVKPLSDFWAEILQFAADLTERVGQQLLQDVGQAIATEKADGSLVTQSDRWADAELRSAIAQAFPAHGVLSEEEAHIFPDTDWCLDYRSDRRHHQFCAKRAALGNLTGLALQRHSCVWLRASAAAEAILSRLLGRRFGLGLFQGEPFSTISRSSPALIHRLADSCLASVPAVSKSCKIPFPAKSACWGSPTYNLLSIAAGITLGGVEATPKIWDIAAVWAIVQAAGGVWMPLEAQPIFPLQVGVDYGDRPYPTLVVSRSEWIPTFLPLVEFLGKR